MVAISLVGSNMRFSCFSGPIRKQVLYKNKQTEKTDKWHFLNISEKCSDLLFVSGHNLSPMLYIFIALSRDYLLNSEAMTVWICADSFAVSVGAPPVQHAGYANDNYKGLINGANIMNLFTYIRHSTQTSMSTQCLDLKSMCLFHNFNIRKWIFFN